MLDEEGDIYQRCRCGGKAYRVYTSLNGRKYYYACVKCQAKFGHTEEVPAHYEEDW